VDITGATGPVLSQVGTLDANGSRFSVVIGSASATPITSREATLNVNNDVTPPTLVSVEADRTGTNVIVTFSEPMGASAFDTVNYQINGSSPVIASNTSPTTVLLNTEQPLATCVSHTLRISDVTDMAGVTISPSPTTTNFTPEVALLIAGPDDGKAWRYDQSATDRSNTWMQVAYDDSGWATGYQVFDAKTTPRDTVSGIPVSTQLSLTNAAISGNVPTYYFRTTFNMPVDVAKVKSLQIRPIIDDGLVLFLNGIPVYSTPSSVTNAPFSAFFPGSSVGDANYGTVTDLPLDSLLRGNNVLAAEVKNQSGTSSDITFGLEMIAILTECAEETRLTLSRTSSGVLQITWSAAGYFLQSAASPLGPWQTLDSATSPYPVNTTTPSMQFYRLIKP
jgi:hypothetical protein